MNAQRPVPLLPALVMVAWLLAALALLVVRALYDQFDSDEFQHGHIAWLMANGQLLYRDFWEHHGPLFALANGWLLKVSGAAPGLNLLFTCRLGSLVATAGIGALTYATARLLTLSRLASLGSTALFLSLLFVQDKGAECRPDTWQNLLWLAGFALTLLNLRRRQAVLALLAGFLLGLAVLSNLKAALGPLCIALYFVFGGRLHRLPAAVVVRELALLAAGGTVALAAVAAWFASQGALEALWHFNVTWNLIAAQGETGNGRGLGYLGLMLRHQAPFMLAVAAGVLFARRLPRAGGGLLLTVAAGTGLGWALNNYTQYFLIFLPLWSVLAAFGVSEALRVLKERVGMTGERTGVAALLAGIALLGWTAVRFTPLAEHPNLAVQKSLAALLLRATARDEPVGVIWDYCGGFVFNQPVQYYWAAEPSIGRAVQRDTRWNPTGADPFGQAWIDALEARQVRFIVGRESDLFTGLPTETQRYVSEHYRNNGCLWKRRKLGQTPISPPTSP